MERTVNNDIYSQFQNIIPQMMNMLNEANDEVMKNVESRYQLHVYDDIPLGDDKEVMVNYESMYDKLCEMIFRKDMSISKGQSSIDKINILSDCIKVICEKEMNDSNELKGCANQIVDRMILKEQEICQKDINARKDLFEQKKLELLAMKIEQTKPTKRHPQYSCKKESILHKDNELKQIDQGMSYLQRWCGLNKYNIIYDSNQETSDSNQSLINKVTNKENLYFISFDDKNNIFGGFLKEQISVLDDWITDSNAFVFSLVRNGKNKYKKYDIKSDQNEFAFGLCSENDYGFLYHFGYDIYVYKLNTPCSFCTQIHFEYNNESKPLAEDSTHTFPVQRVVVLQMN